MRAWSRKKLPHGPTRKEKARGFAAGFASSGLDGLAISF
jgi:hypothetical protein